MKRKRGGARIARLLSKLRDRQCGHRSRSPPREEECWRCDVVGSGARRFRGEFNLNVLDKSIVLVAWTIFEESTWASALVARTDRRARERDKGLAVARSSNCLRKSARQGAEVQGRSSSASPRHGDLVRCGRRPRRPYRPGGLMRLRRGNGVRPASFQFPATLVGPSGGVPVFTLPSLAPVRSVSRCETRQVVVLRSVTWSCAPGCQPGRWPSPGFPSSPPANRSHRSRLVRERVRPPVIIGV
jgi:hypothetical protein